MQKLTKEQMLSELMVKLETIDGKLDKILNQKLVYLQSPEIKVIGAKPGEGAAYIDGLLGFMSELRPPQWPNESYTDYLKRIGEYNTAQSDEEIFREECK